MIDDVKDRISMRLQSLDTAPWPEHLSDAELSDRIERHLAAIRELAIEGIERCRLQMGNRMV